VEDSQHKRPRRQEPSLWQEQDEGLPKPYSGPGRLADPVVQAELPLESAPLAPAEALPGDFDKADFNYRPFEPAEPGLLERWGRHLILGTAGIACVVVAVAAVQWQRSESKVDGTLEVVAKSSRPVPARTAPVPAPEVLPAVIANPTPPDRELPPLVMLAPEPAPVKAVLVTSRAAPVKPATLKAPPAKAAHPLVAKPAKTALAHSKAAKPVLAKAGKPPVKTRVAAVPAKPKAKALPQKRAAKPGQKAAHPVRKQGTATARRSPA
jgi:hypothetical protein